VLFSGFNVDVQKGKFAEKSENNMGMVHIMYAPGTLLSGQGPLHIPQKGNVIWFDQKMKKNKIWMIMSSSG
jgi:hypothetical protein